MRRNRLTLPFDHQLCVPTVYHTLSFQLACLLSWTVQDDLLSLTRQFPPWHHDSVTSDHRNVSSHKHEFYAVIGGVFVRATFLGCYDRQGHFCPARHSLLVVQRPHVNSFPPMHHTRGEGIASFLSKHAARIKLHVS